MNEAADNRLRVIIMCKAPVAGRVKTRLSPPFTPEDAARLHQSMAEAVIERTSSMFSNVWIASDDISHPFFEGFNLPLAEQGEGDLGDRMTRLMQQAFNDGAGSVLFLGTDSPHMPESRLVEAVERLNDHDVVIGPVEDGGYDLIAMNRPCPKLFENISWSTEQVLQQTVQQAEAASISLAFLDMGYDLDRPESLHRAAPIWNAPVPPPEKYRNN
ncbi:MAG: TIGR04282 family arsenosugar biosynthesis glycosyltransferase [Mariprofundaceae bacterium]|nr:TIGR04282 family arsenosugar biosynthesis glycosyltransferase [Mariprofundaceae bacterium]